ncbi:Uncharacterized conserved protein, DUF2267 family [Lutibacter agarilyticus]|uniref:Uncharacterized conserved protein, DUF2267 family n=1 Tax=Lutibacter agarilyticus TaxID=1109740 RepID=A0A238YG98_9FLAO|nr:DUF2267 domain-containing protein [Lutibacter agarilyticus]SNR69828.1 Uncharacterized conserved protein, DUF2267 family [Lutibacter agarilyticus]
MALNFNQYAADANTFMKEYAEKLNIEDKNKAGRMLSAILHGLREVISTEESLQFIAQLPMFLKAVYVNGWSSHKKQRVKSLIEFIDLINRFDGVTAVNDFGSDEETTKQIKTTFLVLRKYISHGELKDIRTELPKELKSLIFEEFLI